eukprot:2871037-Amphidinium_carterae.1
MGLTWASVSSRSVYRNGCPANTQEIEKGLALGLAKYGLKEQSYDCFGCADVCVIKMAQTLRPHSRRPQSNKETIIATTRNEGRNQHWKLRQNAN